MIEKQLPWERPQVALVLSILEGKVTKVDTIKVVSVQERNDNGK